MAKRISDETVELIRTAHELGLSLGEGAPFAEVSRGTFKAWRKKLGLKSPIKQHGENQWSESDVGEQLKTIRAEEGISGLRSNVIGKRHPEVRSAAVSRYGSYSAAGGVIITVVYLYLLSAAIISAYRKFKRNN